jgi:hypothetical protein
LHVPRTLTEGAEEARWEAFAPNGSVRPRWLANQYVSLGTSIGLEIQVREHSLVGGRNPVVVLQPFADRGGRQGSFALSVDEMILTSAQ